MPATSCACCSTSNFARYGNNAGTLYDKTKPRNADIEDYEFEITNSGYVSPDLNNIGGYQYNFTTVTGRSGEYLFSFFHKGDSAAAVAAARRRRWRHHALWRQSYPPPPLPASAALIPHWCHTSTSYNTRTVGRGCCLLLCRRLWRWAPMELHLPRGRGHAGPAHRALNQGGPGLQVGHQVCGLACLTDTALGCSWQHASQGCSCRATPSHCQKCRPGSARPQPGRSQAPAAPCALCQCRQRLAAGPNSVGALN